MSDGLTLEKLKIDERLRDVEKHMSGNIKVLEGFTLALGELKEKVGKQNGRVGKLEAWRAGVLGMMGIIIFLIGKIWK